MNLPDFLTRGLGGEIRLTGHRIDLYHIALVYEEGQTAEMVRYEYPTLPLALIHKVLAFYLEHKAEVDAYLADVDAKIEKLRADTPAAPTLEELRARRRALKSTRST